MRSKLDSPFRDLFRSYQRPRGGASPGEERSVLPALRTAAAKRSHPPGDGEGDLGATSQDTADPSDEATRQRRKLGKAKLPKGGKLAQAQPFSV